jgi:hypothetical protein
LRRNQRPRASFSLAGFEVTLIGRFWVTPEGESGFERILERTLKTLGGTSGTISH